MTQAQSFVPEPITLTANAINQVKSLLEEECNPELKLRVFVTGGGCSGFEYGFAFEKNVAEDDVVIEKDGMTAVVDAMSYPYLMGSTVDYQENLNGSKFVIQNPNATTTCGCGASFSV